MSDTSNPAREAWCTPQALHESWLALLERHRRREFDRAEFDAFAADPMARCAVLSHNLRAGLWRQQALHVFEIAKPGGGVRTLRVPMLEDRVVQAALARWLAAQAEPWLHDACHAYRTGRGTATALQAAAGAVRRGQAWVLKADIEDFFDSVDLQRLVTTLRQRGLWAHRLAHVLRQVLYAEVAAPAGAYCLWRGLAQGSPLSPVLANIALHEFDVALAATGATLVRYADDFLLLADTRAALTLAHAAAMRTLAEEGLRLHAAKTQWLEPGMAVLFLGRTVKADSDPQDGRAANGEAPAQIISTAEANDDTAAQDAGTPAASRAAVPLLRTLYLLTEHTRLARDGDSLLVEAPGDPDRRIPGARLNQVLAFGATSLSSGAIALCLEMGIPVMLTSSHGRHFGVVDPLVMPNVPLLVAQIDASRDDTLCLEAARALVAAKLRNTALLQRRWQRHAPLDAGAAAARRIAEAARRADAAGSLESLRGIEGAAAAAHYGAMAARLSPDWGFVQRRRQPPTDPVNSMLSYGYTVLYYNTLTLLLARGLHPHIGFLHAPRPGHHALASDMMEPFRPLVVDAVVMDLARNGGLAPHDFDLPAAAGAPCLMHTDARNRLIHALEARFNTRLALRGSDVQLDLRRLMDMQVLSLLDRLRGRSGAFCPYVGR